MTVDKIEVVVPAGLAPLPDLVSQPHCLVAKDSALSRTNDAWVELFDGGWNEEDSPCLSLGDCVRVLTIPQLEDVWTVTESLGFMAFPCVLLCGPSSGAKCQLLVIPGSVGGGGLVILFPSGVNSFVDRVDGNYFPEGAESALKELTHGESRSGSDRLTAREVQIVGLLAKGFSGPRIAAYLSIAESTVQAHVQNAMRKTGSATRTSLVATAMSDGVIKV